MEKTTTKKLTWNLEVVGKSNPNQKGSTKAYLKPCQTFKMGLFAKTVKSF